MADPIVAPDVATQPNATPAPAPDISNVAPPSQPAPPPNSAIVPAEYTSSGMPQAVPTPTPSSPSSNFRAGFSGAAGSPKFAADESGQIKSTTPPARGFSGLLGSILGGGLRGAAYGMAAEKGESGAAAAQRLSEQANQQAKAIAQQNFENKRQMQKDALEHALVTAQTVSLQQRLKMAEEEHAASMTKLGFENADLMRQQRISDQAEKTSVSTAKAELIAHGIAPLHELKPNKSASASSAADLKGGAATGALQQQSVLGQMKVHAANIANGKLMPVQNGEDGEDSGIDLYKMEDLNKPITKAFFYQLPTGLTNPDGTPVMTDKAILPGTGKTYGDALAEIHAANAQLDRQNAVLAQQEERKKNALAVPESEAKIATEKSVQAKNYAEAAQARANTPGAGGAAITPPQGYTPPAVKDLMTMPVQQLQQRLKAAGAPDTPYLGTLQNVARYDTELEKAFTNTKRKGVNQTDREQALDYIVKWINPNFSAGNANARVQFLRGWANGNSGDGASIRRMNTAIGHLGLLGQAAQVLAQDQGGSSLPFLNKIAQEYGLQTGSDPTLVYQGIANKAAAEAAGAVKGGSGSATDQEIEKAAQGFNPAWAPQQQASWLRDQMQILSEADSTLRQVFHDNMQTSPEEAGRSILSPKNQQIMNQWVHSGATPTGNAVNPNAPGAQVGITPAAAAYLNNR